MKKYKHKTKGYIAVLTDWAGSSCYKIIKSDGTVISGLYHTPRWMVEESSDWEEVKEKQFKYKEGDEVIIFSVTNFNSFKTCRIDHQLMCPYDYKSGESYILESQIVCKTSEGFITADNELIRYKKEGTRQTSDKFYYVSPNRPHLLIDSFVYSYYDKNRIFKNQQKAKEFQLQEAKLFSLKDLKEMSAFQEGSNWHIIDHLTTEAKKRLGYE